MGLSDESTTPVRELGYQLRKERKRARPSRPKGYRVSDIPRDICAERTLRDLEAGRKPRVKSGMVSDLCEFYGTDVDLMRELRALAKATQVDRWTDYYSSAIDNRYWLFLQREARADRIKTHDTNFVSTLLQHEAYIDAVQQSIRIPWEKDDLDFTVAKQLRLERQQRWRKARTRTTAIIGEAALLLNMGDSVMEAQKVHLLELAELPHVDIRITPLSAGRHDVHGTEFGILDFNDDNENVIYVAGPYAGRYVPPTSRVGQFFVSCFDVVTDISIPVKEFLA